MPEQRPKGSGWFAAIIGALFLLMLFFIDLRKVDPYTLTKAWLFFAAIILLGWGINRILKGEKGWTVGQNTINWVVGIVGATFAILAILLQE